MEHDLFAKPASPFPDRALARIAETPPLHGADAGLAAQFLDHLWNCDVARPPELAHVEAVFAQILGRRHAGVDDGDGVFAQAPANIAFRRPGAFDGDG